MKQRDAQHVDEAEHRVVVRAGERVALARAHAQRRVVAGVEDPRRVDGPAAGDRGRRGRRRARCRAPGPSARSAIRTLPSGVETRVSPTTQYRMAAGGSSSIEPKLPWPSTSS